MAKGRFKKALQDAGKNIKQTTQAAVKNVQQTTQTAVKNVKGTTKGVVGKVKGKVKVKNKLGAFAALLPLKSSMVKMLRKKGHPVSMKDSIKTVATMFNDVFIKGKQKFNYAAYRAMAHVDAAAASTAQSGGGIDAAAVAAGAPVVLDIVRSILEFFKNMKKKKDDGQPLDEVEAAGLIEAEKKAAEPKKKKGLFNLLFGWLFN